MQLPDEAIAYNYQALLAPMMEEWTPAAEMRQQHFLSQSELRDLIPRVLQVRSQVATERDLKQVPPEMMPLDAGFIDLPQKLLDQQRKQNDVGVLGRITALASHMRDQVDRFVVLGIGGSYLGSRALFEALRSSFHNDLAAKDRSGTPRVYFEGNNADNDTLQELFELLSITCIDPDQRDERWGVAVISKSGDTLEPAIAYRAIRRELAEYYGLHSPQTKSLIVPITGETGKLRALCAADGFAAENILTIPTDIGGRYSVFTPAGLFPASVMGLDVRALLLGASAMTRRFFEERFENNPVLQYAAVNYLMSTQHHKPIRVLSVWSKKLEALGFWYDHLLSESLAKQGLGATPLTTVGTRDMHARGQQFQEGARDTVINNVIVKSWSDPPMMIGMADRNEDELNQYNRKSIADVMSAAHEGATRAYCDVARPTADIVLPNLTEHTMGQLMQMLMLATVVEGRLLGVNPYGQPGVEPYKRNMMEILKKPAT